jgi:hypothetical protein
MVPLFLMLHITSLLQARRAAAAASGAVSAGSTTAPGRGAFPISSTLPATSVERIAHDVARSANGARVRHTPTSADAENTRP